MFKQYITPIAFVLIAGVCLVCMFLPTKTIHNSPEMTVSTPPTDLIIQDRALGLSIGMWETVKHYPNLYAGLGVVLWIAVGGFIVSIRQIKEDEG